jgi:hypothetical protein
MSSLQSFRRDDILLNVITGFVLLKTGLIINLSSG